MNSTRNDVDDMKLKSMNSKNYKHENLLKISESVFLHSRFCLSTFVCPAINKMQN